jgi:hypothetical protein
MTYNKIYHKDCFAFECADEKNGCTALKEQHCEGCSFYKTDKNGKSIIPPQRAAEIRELLCKARPLL